MIIIEYPTESTCDVVIANHPIRILPCDQNGRIWRALFDHCPDLSVVTIV